MADGQDLLQQITGAGGRLDPRLSDRDVDRLVTGAQRRLRRRVRRRALLVVASVTVPVVALVIVHGRLPFGARSTAIVLPPAVVVPVPDRSLHLADGSLATPLDATSEILLGGESAARVDLALTRGRGRFEVTPRAQRVFAVRAGDVTVTVLGTIFTVERIADRVGVAVERGTVRVEWGVGSRLLQKGESGWFPPLHGGGGVAEPTAPAALQPAPRAKAARAKPLALAGDPTPTLTKEEGAEAMLLAADRARLAGHPEAGAALLQTLLRDHRDDPRAPLAAFTLGRLLLMELGRPRDAAAAFAEVRRLAPGGSFAEDALAREVEAWSQAGQSDLAHTRALEYLRLFPGGRRVGTVRSLGKVD